MEISVLTVKGQATIPAEIRRHLKLRAGDQIGFEVDSKGRVLLRKCVREEVVWARALESTLTKEWGSDLDDDL